ncbi:MAG TPA: PDZ domain-containing protein [Actinomycetota bacterium]
MDPRNTTTHPLRTPDPEQGLDDARVAPRRRRLAAIITTIVVVIGVGSIVRVPVHSVGPGPARDVLDLIKVDGTATHPSKGKLLLTTASVSGQPLTIWEYVYVWLDPSLATTPLRTVVQPGLDDEEQDAQNFLAMEQSKLLAELAAFEVLGQPAVRIRGARVLSVIQDGPADGELRPRDLIVAIEGRDVADEEDVGRLVRGVGVGETLAFLVRRDGRERTVEIVTGPSRDDPDSPVVGVYVGQAWRLPYEIEIDTEQIGGPSGGLVFALSIVDVLTPDDLTRGHVIAATGTIERDDEGEIRIGTIGAVAEKVRAARAAGATVFMLPAGEAAQAERLAPDDMIVIGVETLMEAIDALGALPVRPAS